MTPRSRTTILLLLVLAMLSISSADRADTPGLAESRAASDAFDLVSSDAAAVVLIPDLKRAGDELAAWLDASEQAHVLFGDRPVEQILDVLGLRVGVDEGAPAAILWMTADPGASPVFLVPVTDPRDYLESNYDPHPDGPADAWIHATGEVVHARSLEGHVVISEEAELARTYAPAAGMREKLLELFGTEATRRAAAGEFIAYADGSALRAFRAISNRRAAASAPLDQADGGENAETSDSGVPALLRGARATLLVANVHPLGLGLSSFIAYEPGSILGRLTAGGEGAAASMSRLPDVPFFLAASADIEGLGGGAVLRLLSGGAFDLPQWLTAARAVQFAAAPGRAGLRGGLVNEAVLFLATDRPKSVIDAIRADLLALDHESAAFETTQEWTEAAREVGGVTLDAYRVDFEFEPGATRERMIHNVLFGIAGCRGYVGAVDEGVLVTFSQRTDVFARAVEAARRGRSLAHDPTLERMRAWLPPETDLEVFFGVGSIGYVLDQFIALVRPFLPMQIELPAIDPGTNPVGFGVCLGDGRLESGVVVPRDVLVLVLDALAEQLLRFDRRVNGALH